MHRDEQVGKAERSTAARSKIRSVSDRRMEPIRVGAGGACAGMAAAAAAAVMAAVTSGRKQLRRRYGLRVFFFSFPGRRRHTFCPRCPCYGTLTTRFYSVPRSQRKIFFRGDVEVRQKPSQLREGRCFALHVIQRRAIPAECDISKLRLEEVVCVFFFFFSFLFFLTLRLSNTEALKVKRHNQPTTSLQICLKKKNRSVYKKKKNNPEKNSSIHVRRKRINL